MTDIRSLLKPGKQVLWSGYLHARAEDQTSLFEYCNMSQVDYDLQAMAISMDGEIIPSIPPQHVRLRPGESFQLTSTTWLKDFKTRPFSGQVVILLEELSGQGSYPIAPAIMSHWQSSSSYSEVASQGFTKLNTQRSIGNTSFFMFFPGVFCDEQNTTWFVLFNHSTEPTYQDQVELTPYLYGLDGETLQGKAHTLLPFGAFILDVSEHFGDEGLQLLKRHAGRGSVSISHRGHVLPSFFFHVDKQTQKVITGNHTQPPAAVLSTSRIWWGKLRQLVV